MATYLITGAGGGMGSVLCRKLAREGHRVLGIDLVLPDSMGGVRFFSADITRTEDLQAVADNLHAEGIHLDGIIHMAGIYDLNSLVEMPEEDFCRDFNVNLFGLFRVNRLFLPLLGEGGRIVIISSELAPPHPLPFTGIYAVTTTAGEHYAEALRMELQLLGHPVVVIRPGAVRTGMLPASTEKLDRFCRETRLYPHNAGRFKRIVSRVEARNVPPETIADTVRKALTARKPRLVYKVNRNPLLLLFSRLPQHLQLRIIRKILA